MSDSGVQVRRELSGEVGAQLDHVRPGGGFRSACRPGRLRLAIAMRAGRSTDQLEE